MRGGLWILTALIAWAALYNVIQALMVRPPVESDLRQIAGVVRQVDTPVPRNRLAPFSELVIETATAQSTRLPVRHEALDRAAAERLIGQHIVARVASERPRNRWVYDLSSNGRPVLELARERARDADRRRNHLLWSAGFALLAIGLGVSARSRPTRRRPSD